MKFWELKNEKDADEAELYIFGNIESDDGFFKGKEDKSAPDIVKELQKVSAKRLTVHINSYGGDVKEGLAIYNTIKNTGADVTTINDGFACSAASVIFMAGKQRVMNDASLLMIHNPYMMTMGNPEELRKAADDLEVIAQASVEAYKNHSSLSEEKIKEMMAAESWILPQEAVDYGFATEIRKGPEEKGVNQSAMAAIMKKLTAPEAQPDETQLFEVTMEEAALAPITEKLDSVLAKVAEIEKKVSEDPALGKPEQKKTGFNAFF